MEPHESNDDYPYKKYVMSEGEIRARFERLKGYKLTLVTGIREYKIINLVDTVSPLRMMFRGIPTIAHVSKSSYDDFDNISDRFNEKPRLSCKRYDQKLTPREYWDSVKFSLKKQFPNNPHKQREYLYENYMECTSFKPSLLVGFAKHLCKDKPRILDISSGWGDRLIGAIAVAECYAGCDPNEQLFPGYNEIIKFFDADPKKFTVENTTFQKMKLPDWRPNLVFTSPPYYNLEEYNGSTTPSTVDAWINEFLYPSLEKAANALEFGGFLVININDIRETKNKNGYYKNVHFVSRMLDFYLPNMIYMGCISQSQMNGDYPKSPQPFWIWKKIELNPVMNPPIVLENFSRKNDGEINFSVVRDDLLLGGTKQRVIEEIYDSHPEGIIYPGPSHGFAQIALALGARINAEKNHPRDPAKYNKALILIPKIRPPSAQTLLSSQLGANIIEFAGNSSALAEMKKKAHEFAKQYKMHVPKLGFEGKEFANAIKNALETCLIGADNKPMLEKNTAYEFWLAAGSGTLALALLNEFPSSHVNVVQIGKQIDWYFKDNPRATLHIAPERFTSPAVEQPEYPSTYNYDAKVWQFVSKRLKNHAPPPPGGLVIWNVAGNPSAFSV